MNTLFRALNDATRRRILELLRERDRTAGEIAAAFEMTRPSISYHLDLLKQADLVTAVKEGKYVRYALNTTVLEEAVHWLLTLLSEASHDDDAP